MKCMSVVKTENFISERPDIHVLLTKSFICMKNDFRVETGNIHEVFAVSLLPHLTTSSIIDRNMFMDFSTLFIHKYFTRHGRKLLNVALIHVFKEKFKYNDNIPTICMQKI